MRLPALQPADEQTAFCWADDCETRDLAAVPDLDSIACRGPLAELCRAVELP